MKRLSKLLLLVTVLITGSTVMALELLGARLLSVCYGGSMHVWAAMISVTLLSLAAGYYLGGVLADHKPESRVLFAIILASGLFAWAAPYARYLIRSMYGGLSITSGTLVSSFTVFFVPLTLLGMCGPFVIRLLSSGPEGAGRTAGSVYAVSTIGSVVGTLATALWLIPTWGTPLGFRICGCALIILAALGLGSAGHRLCLLLLFVPVVLGTILPVGAAKPGRSTAAPGGGAMTLVHIEETAYGRLAVIDKNDERLLLMNGILQTGMPIEHDHLYTGAKLQHENYFLELTPYCFDDPRGKKALLIGLAGGLMAQVLALHGIDTTAVEIDPEVVAVAREFFHFDSEAIVGDGRRVLASLDGPYDMCIIDAYSGDTFPFHLASAEMWRAVAEVLAGDGVVGINYIGVPDDRAIASLLRTVGSAFDYIRAFRTENGTQAQAITILASNRGLGLSQRRWLSDLDYFEGVDPVSAALARLEMRPLPIEGSLLLDDHNPIDFERAQAALRWRAKTATILGTEVMFW